MLKIVVLIGLVLLSTSVLASGHKVGLVELMAPDHHNSDYSVFATDGRIYNLAGSNSKLAEIAENAIASGSDVKLKLSEHIGAEDLLDVRNEILDIKLISEKKMRSSAIASGTPLYSEDVLMSDYVTDVKDEYKVADYFLSLNKNTKRRSQCFNRAHVWSWELSFNKIDGKRVQMGKTWLFFTRKYIRTYNYKWWFHIAPFLTVNDEVKVMDRVFMPAPVSIDIWTQEFIYSKEQCKIVKKYSDFRDHQFERDCYIILSSVHYWQPKTVEQAELDGLAPEKWKRSILNSAYKDALGRFSKVPDRD